MLDLSKGLGPGVGPVEKICGCCFGCLSVYRHCTRTHHMLRINESSPRRRRNLFGQTAIVTSTPTPSQWSMVGDSAVATSTARPKARATFSCWRHKNISALPDTRRDNQTIDSGILRPAAFGYPYPVVVLRCLVDPYRAGSY